ncbi:MAG: trypsin-like peptidase domain-containing protein [Specibacter sp.]
MTTTNSFAGRGKGVVIGGAAAVVLLSGVVGGVAGSVAGGAAAPAPSSSLASTVAGTCDAVQVAGAALPAIVTVSVSVSKGDESGVGSGVIVRADGHIMTNNHVISAAADGGSIKVLFSGGNSAPATLVGRDPLADIAVLKVDAAKDVPNITLGDSGAVKVGQPVVALGAPLGLSSTVTSGIVSALGRNVPVPSDNNSTAILVGAIQTDASINPGNSGGALVDCSGKLIGINTAIATVPSEDGAGGGGSVGIGFAVPINLAASVANQLIDNGKVAYPYFGVSAAPIPPSAAERFGVENGLYLQAVVANGPAAKAGLAAGDVITHIDGQVAADTGVLSAIAVTRKAGDKAKVTYVRGTKTATTTLTLGTQP